MARHARYWTAGKCIGDFCISNITSTRSTQPLHLWSSHRHISLLDTVCKPLECFQEDKSLCWHDNISTSCLSDSRWISDQTIANDQCNLQRSKNLVTIFLSLGTYWSYTHDGQNRSCQKSQGKRFHQPKYRSKDQCRWHWWEERFLWTFAL
jgi:hypothetical protein